MSAAPSSSTTPSQHSLTHQSRELSLSGAVSQRCQALSPPLSLGDMLISGHQGTLCDKRGKGEINPLMERVPVTASPVSHCPDLSPPFQAHGECSARSVTPTGSS